MNNIEELREHCEEMIAISRMQYAYIPASSIITLIDRIEKAEKESKQWYSVVEAAISDDAEWRKQSNTASEAIGYLTTGIVMLKERAEKAEAALSAANEKLKAEQVPVAYFAAAPDYGWDMFNNKEDAIATCQAEIDAYRECRDDGWDDDVQRVCWGIVIQKAEGFDHQGVHTSSSHHTYQTCDYSLQPVAVEGNADEKEKN